MDELGCLISFILIATQNTELNKRQKRKEFFRFIKDKDEIFHALDIRIQIPPAGSLNQSYDLVVQQIDLLEPDKKQIFMQIYQLYVNQNKDDAARRDQVRANEDEKRLRREREAAEAMRNKEEQLRQLNEKIRKEREEAQNSGG